MPDEVTLDVTTIEENVTVETTAGDVVGIQVVAPTGPAGATGPAGPNSVTSATTSDGTANLSLSNVSTATATVSGLLTAGHIHGNLAGTLYTHVRTGEAVSKGDPVYVSGFHNGTGQAIVMRADASDAGKMPAIGVMDAAYAENISSANCVIAGTITSVDTDDFSINSPVYVGDGGGFSETIGTIPQQVGIVERSNTNNGAFVVTNNKVISSADISDFATAVEAIAPNAVTSATTSDGTASLDISNLTLSQAITSGLQPKLVFTANPTAVGDGQQILWQWYDGTTTTTTASISSEATGSTTDKLIFQTTTGGSLATSLDLTNELATFSGSISSLGESYRATSTFTYASGAAAAHRTALGLTTLATTTPGTNVANFLEFPTSANLASALTDENGTGGGFVRAEGATLTTPTFTGSAARANGQNAVPATSDEVMTRGQSDSRIGKVAVMSADVTVVSSTTPVPLTASSSNHPDGLSELGFTLAANKTYAFEFIGEFYEETSPKNQLFTLAGPSGSSFSSRIIAGASGSTAVYQIGGGSTVFNLISSGSFNGMIKIYGLIKMGGTSGNVTLRFSQNSSTANPTTIKKGSTMILFGGA